MKVDINAGEIKNNYVGETINIGQTGNSVEHEIGSTIDKKQKGFYLALLSSYGSIADLRQMVKFGLGQNLDELAGGDNLKQVTFNLTIWAEQYGKMDELIKAAYHGNPENAALCKFIEKYSEELEEG